MWCCRQGAYLASLYKAKKETSKLLARLAGYLSNRTLVGVDKVGNRHFTRTEEIDGIMKEKRWVVFKGEEDPTSLPVEWICWLNGQRKRAPTPEELIEMEARRELVKQNVARKTGGPDLKSFIRKFPTASAGALSLSTASPALMSKYLLRISLLGFSSCGGGAEDFEVDGLSPCSDRILSKASFS